MIQPGFALWLTGLPASGKTTIARDLARALNQHAIHTQILDSDELRQTITPHPTYSTDERDQFYRILATIAYLLTANGVSVIIAATAHKQLYRDTARQQIGQFIEVYVQCPLTTCIERDEKGIYQQAKTGEATTVPGLQVPYEAPAFPEIVVDSENESATACVRHIVDHLKRDGLLATMTT